MIDATEALAIEVAQKAYDEALKDFNEGVDQEAELAKAKEELGWKSEITVQEMCKEMIQEDYKAACRALLLKENKLDLPNSIQD